MVTNIPKEWVAAEDYYFFIIIIFCIVVPLVQAIQWSKGIWTTGKTRYNPKSCESTLLFF